MHVCIGQGGDFVYYYQRLRDLREDCDKTQADLAAVLGTHREQYRKYEAGIQELPMHHFITLARYYNVSLDYLAGLTNTYRTLDGSAPRFTKKYNLNQNGNITNNFS